MTVESSQRRPLLTRTEIAGIMARHGLEPHRTLGQNFVVDPNTIRRIVRLARVGVGDRVLEIGPGLGSLTLGLLDAGAAITALEIDSRLAPALAEVLGDRARVVIGDALTEPLAPIVGDGPVIVVANLPYNVSTHVILRLLDECPNVVRLVVMVQREVAERLVAPAGDPHRGIPSVRVEYWADARIVGGVSAEVFHPRPRVMSSIVEITRRESTAGDVDEERFVMLVRTGFGQRRKMLRRSLDGVVTAAELERAGVDPAARAETLTLDQWCSLARLGGLS